MAYRKTGLLYKGLALMVSGLICGFLAMVDIALAADEEAGEDAVPGLPVYLYFADPDQPYLLAEDRPTVEAVDPVDFCRLLVESLIRGPSGVLSPTIPRETILRSVFIHDKTAYVDFGREISAAHPGGIVTEMLTVYSIVNTVVLNMDGVDQVKLLIEGRDAETLAGHIDIRLPLTADMMLIR